MQSNTPSPHLPATASFMQVDSAHEQNASSPNTNGPRFGFLVDIAQDILTIASEITAKCDRIESAFPIIPVTAREALSKYLVENKVSNPGMLNDRHRRLCAWTLLEHQARNPGTQRPVSLSQVASYIKPEEALHFADLARAMSVRIDSLAP